MICQLDGAEIGERFVDEPPTEFVLAHHRFDVPGTPLPASGIPAPRHLLCAFRDRGI